MLLRRRIPSTHQQLLINPHHTIPMTARFLSNFITAFSVDKISELEGEAILLLLHTIDRQIIFSNSSIRDE